MNSRRLMSDRVSKQGGGLGPLLLLRSDQAFVCLSFVQFPPLSFFDNHGIVYLSEVRSEAKQTYFTLRLFYE